MNLKKLLTWLTAGLLIAFLVSRVVKANYNRTHQLMSGEDINSLKS
jgi:hypothetical protein